MPSPFLPPCKPGTYTLVVDLDETLGHYDEAKANRLAEELASQWLVRTGRAMTEQEIREQLPGIEFKVRPFALEFLEQMSQFYEIVIFTAADQQYADEILDKLDVNRRISHRLYRQHTLQYQNVYTGEIELHVKDLSRMGRDMARTIIVDNLNDNFRLQRENGYHIKEWKGDKRDNELEVLMTLLRSIVVRGSEDVRPELANLHTLQE